MKEGWEIWSVRVPGTDYVGMAINAGAKPARGVYLLPWWIWTDLAGWHVTRSSANNRRVQSPQGDWLSWVHGERLLGLRVWAAHDTGLSLSPTTGRMPRGIDPYDILDGIAAGLRASKTT